MDTSASLLERLRRPDQPEAWRRFVQLYAPLLFSWARRAGLQEPDAADLVQDVLLLLVRKLPEFTYDRHKSFRAWLRTVTRNRWRQTLRGRPPPAQPLDGLGPAEPAAADGDAFAEAEYRRHLVGRAQELVRGDFQPATWKAWCEYGVAGRPVEEVARELGLTPRAVYLAKARVLRRLRQELEGLLD